ncbi:MAG: cystathionine gamma-synthase [Candidatus Palauibacterales bacterium]|nr:cystathionine gamma-synthase [Candidatus Palauibacterales bacterium]
MADGEQGFGTRAIHAGQRPDPTSGAVMTPIYQTSTYVQDAVGEPRGGHEYARVTNPTRGALEGNLASLEAGRHGAAFASGMAAIEAVVKGVLSRGDHVVCGANVYGGTDRLFRTVWSRFGLDFTYVDTSDVDALSDAMRPETRLVHVETPTNPMMGLSDLRACAEVTHDGDALLMVDNTFATPYLQRPLTMGADLVVHSTTKYLNGHSDVVGGAVVTDDDGIAEELRYQQKAAGAVPGPMDCWLVLRGTKTLHARMRAHCENAGRIAEHLAEHPEIEEVFYPGLPDHPQHELARRQMDGFGGMITVETGSADRARRLAEGTRVFALAESLGGVESLVSVPAAMTHASVPEEKRRAIGLTDGLVRLSVGIEDPDDLEEDLDRALASL